MEAKNSFIEITVLVQGIKVDEQNNVKIKEIVQAKDDVGTTMKRVSSFFGDRYESNNQLKIRLEVPSRQASKISVVEGSIKDFSPSEANGSRIVVRNISQMNNKNLLSKYASDVKLTLIDAEAFNKMKEADEKMMNKEIEKLKKEMGLGDEVEATIDAIKQFIDGFSSFGSSGESLSFFVDDANEKIVEILILNAKGEKMNYGSSRMGKDRLTLNVREKIADDWRIEILLENEKSMKEYKFKLENIILP